MTDPVIPVAPAAPVAPVRGKTPTDTVLVGCKLPNGLKIHRGRWRTDSWLEVELIGSNKSRIVDANGKTTYGITRVDRTFITQWMKDHARVPAVAGGMIFFAEKQDDVESYFGADQRKHGLEPLDPSRSLPKGVAQLNAKD